MYDHTTPENKKDVKVTGTKNNMISNNDGVLSRFLMPENLIN